MKLTSQILSATSFTPTFWPAKTVETLIFWRPKQTRPHRVTVVVRGHLLAGKAPGYDDRVQEAC